MPAGRVAALEEEGLASTDPVSREDSESEVEVVDGLNMCLAQAMSHYQREEQRCFVCGSPGHFTRDCPHCDAFKRWHRKQLNCKGVGQNSLNACMKKDSYPLPCIQEALESMAGLAHFPLMDFKSGFWQIKMAPGSQQYMAFTVGNLGFYEFTRMPFGLCNAPVTFQHLMQNTLGELNLMYCVIYLDDVIVFGRTEEERLRIMFKRFWEFNLKPKPSKCLFFQSEIVYLAHHISQGGILPSRDNV